MFYYGEQNYHNEPLFCSVSPQKVYLDQFELRYKDEMRHVHYEFLSNHCNWYFTRLFLKELKEQVTPVILPSMMSR